MRELVVFDNLTLVGVSLENILSKNNSKVVGNYQQINKLASDLKARLKPNTVVLSMGSLTDEELQWIRTIDQSTEAPILILCEGTQYERIKQAFNYGADGCVLKQDNPTEIDSALSRVEQGERYLTSSVGLDLLTECVPDIPEGPKVQFTAREMEILELIASGLTNQEIGDKIFVSRRTVEGHRQSLLTKTNSANTAQLIRNAMRMHLIR